MCGIVGAIADRDVVPVLIEGLKRLEYRGYDSAGIAVIDGNVRRVRSWIHWVPGGVRPRRQGLQAHTTTDGSIRHHHLFSISRDGDVNFRPSSRCTTALSAPSTTW